MSAPHPLIAIVGPTGSAKSRLVARLAVNLGGEIVNCDSLQVYRRLDIGTAKPSVDERSGVPHHLFDIVDPEEHFTAGDYARRARDTLTGIAARGAIPMLAGGTGFYLSALLDGLFGGPERNEAVRARLGGRETRRPGSLHRLLRRLDPPSASRIHANDTQKLIRALEVCITSQRAMTEMFQSGRSTLTGFACLLIGLDPPRSELYARLDARAVRMFEGGLLEEVRSVLAAGVSPLAKPLQSLGYRQALAVLRGETDLPAAISSTQQETRRYAKRQWTWFRRDSRIEWFSGFGDDPAIESLVGERVAGHLRTHHRA